MKPKWSEWTEIFVDCIYTVLMLAKNTICTAYMIINKIENRNAQYILWKKIEYQGTLVMVHTICVFDSNDEWADNYDINHLLVADGRWLY